MASKLNPYLQFKDNAREAMTYYKDVFGGELNDQHLRRVDGGGDGRRRHARPARGAQRLHADGLRHPARHGLGGTGGNITISLSGDDDADLRGYWDKLADGGQVMMPLEKQMWGDEFGMLADRFGISWMVNIVGEQNQG